MFHEIINCSWIVEWLFLERHFFDTFTINTLTEFFIKTYVTQAFSLRVSHRWYLCRLHKPCLCSIFTKMFPSSLSPLGRTPQAMLIRGCALFNRVNCINWPLISFMGLFCGEKIPWIIFLPLPRIQHGRVTNPSMYEIHSFSICDQPFKHSNYTIISLLSNISLNVIFVCETYECWSST